METRTLKVRTHPENVAYSATGDVYIATTSPFGSCDGFALSKKESSLCVPNAKEKQVPIYCIGIHRQDRRDVVFLKLN